MKTNSLLIGRFSRTFYGAILGAMLVPTALFGQPSPAGTNDSFTWDCVMSGARRGVAYLTFANDFTFRGYEVLVPKRATPPLPSPDVDPRTPGGNTGRTGTTGSTTNSTTKPTDQAISIFGSEPVVGPWGFDINGRVIGYFIEVAGDVCVTNTTVVTNTDLTITTNTTINCATMTNAISFVGKVVPGKRLTLVCSTPNGKVTYVGVPLRTAPTVPDLTSSDWYGVEKQRTQTFIEFLSLEPSETYSDNPNIYDVFGAGPGYSYRGRAVLSSQKCISLSLWREPDGSIVRAVTGPYTFNRRSGKFIGRLTGWDQPAGTMTNWVSFTIVKPPQQ